jgi:hypothetical protein
LLSRPRVGGYFDRGDPPAQGQAASDPSRNATQDPRERHRLRWTEFGPPPREGYPICEHGTMPPSYGQVTDFALLLGRVTRSFAVGRIARVRHRQIQIRSRDTGTGGGNRRFSSCRSISTLSITNPPRHCGDRLRRAHWPYRVFSPRCVALKTAQYLEALIAELKSEMVYGTEGGR